METTVTELVALERTAFDGWIKGDPDFNLGLLDPGVTCFDPGKEGRLDRAGLVAYFEEYRGKFGFGGYEILDPQVQTCGEAAILTYLLVLRKGETPSRYNATHVYHRTGAGWRVLHSHWSAAKMPAPPKT